MNYVWRFSDDKPIYTQIAEQLQKLIAAGELKPGDKLDSVRELASEAQVNPNTMLRALSELEQRKLLISHRVNGKTITEDTELINKTKEELAAGVINAFTESMKQLGYTKEEAADLLKKHTEV